MHCPVLGGYLRELQNKLAECPGMYEEETLEYIAELTEKTEPVVGKEDTISLLRAFYLVRVLCMIHVQAAMSQIFSSLIMDQEGTKGLILLAQESKQSWSGLSAAVDQVSALIVEVRIERAGTAMRGKTVKENPMLFDQLSLTLDALERTLHALCVLRRGLDKEGPETLHDFITAYLEVERLLSTPVHTRLTCVEDMLRITPTTTVVPRRLDLCPVVLE
jgi:hypothetical protein